MSVRKRDENPRVTQLGIVPTWVPKDAPLAVQMAAAANHDPPAGAPFLISARKLEACAEAAERAGNRREALWVLALAANQRRLEFLASEKGYELPPDVTDTAARPAPSRGSENLIPRRARAKRSKVEFPVQAPVDPSGIVPQWALDEVSALPPLVTDEQLAKFLGGCSTRTIRRRRDRGSFGTTIHDGDGSAHLTRRIEVARYLARKARR